MLGVATTARADVIVVAALSDTALLPSPRCGGVDSAVDDPIPEYEEDNVMPAGIFIMQLVSALGEAQRWSHRQCETETGNTDRTRACY